MDDGYHYVNESVYQYDMVYIDAFLEDAIPSQMESRQFFVNLQQILTNNGCVITNVNVPSSAVFNRIIQRLCSIFESNILLAHTNTIENARVIISGKDACLRSISSKADTIHQAERFEIEARLEFSLSHIISRAYRGLIEHEE